MEDGPPGDCSDGIAKMNVLVVGYGSIGRRHIRNLSKMEPIDEIIVYTKIQNAFEALCEKKISFLDASILGLDTVTDRYKVDFAIIANETYKHIDTAIILARKGIHLFIEKPLSHNLEKVAPLKEIVEKNRVKAFVAYNLRFLPAIRHLKDQISQKVLGDLYFAHIEVGQYLPSWRTNVHYTASYSAHAEFGGGAALDLSHEVDYMRYLFGEPYLWKTVKSKVSDLDIDSEDILEGIYKYERGFMCHVHMDYLQRKAKRQIRIFGSTGEIICDFAGKWIDIQLHGNKTRLMEEDLFKMAETYRTELQYFIETLMTNKEPAISIDDGIQTLRLLEDSHDR